MRLHLVELENWKKHNKISIDFDSKSTIIHGPNEQGKSTIFEALSKGFFDKSSSRAESIRNIKPKTATGDITSSVRIEFTLNKTRYRVEKNFNYKTGTYLYKIDGEEPSLLAQDHSADEQLIEMLEAQFPSVKGSKPSQWGAFHWLWALQENRDLPTEKEGDPTTSLHLETKEGSDVLITPKFQAVQGLVQKSYSTFYTATGKDKGESPISTYEKDITYYEQRKGEINKKINDIEDQKRKLEELQELLPGYETKIKNTKDELEKAKTEASDISSVESELRLSEASVKDAQRDLVELEKALKELKESEKRIRLILKDEKELIDKLSRLEVLCDHMEKEQKAMKEDINKKAEAIRKTEELAKDARILWTRSENQKKIKDIVLKIDKIKNIDKKIEVLKKQQNTKIPTDFELNKHIQDESRIITLKESLVEKGLAVDITPGEKGVLDVEVDGEEIIECNNTITGTESVIVSKPGWGAVNIKAKLEQAFDAKIDIRNLDASIKATFNTYNVKSTKELIELSHKQKKISYEIDTLIAEKKGIAEIPLNELILEVTNLRKGYKDKNKTTRTPYSIAKNPIDGDLGNLIKKREKEEEQARLALDVARTKRDQMDKKLSENKQKLAEARAEHKNCSENLEISRSEQHDIISKYGTEDHNNKLISSAQEKLDEVKNIHQSIQKRYEQYKKGPIYKIDRLEQEIENQEQLLQQHQSSIDQLKGKISMASMGGEYSELVDIESSLEILRERLEKENIKAKSYQLLKELLEQQHRTLLLSVVDPIKEDVRSSLSYATGFLHEEVELNEYLFPVRLGERGFEGVLLEFNDASSGLKELLTACVRLAVAKHLSKRDSQCLILDDPFVHVSSDRSNKMIELINEAINKYSLQVVVFTHRPIEFTGFTGGEMIDITSMPT